MEDNIHPVVRLLAKRMESHPEEFGYKGSGRWSIWLEALHNLATPEEKLLLRTARMDEIHEQVMDELLNGEARREEERRQRKEAEERYVQKQQAQLQQLQQQAAVIQRQEAARLYGQAQQYTNHIAPAPALQLGSETIDEGMLKQIKRKLGL